MTSKSLLNGRTEAQFEFDWGVKGWAFSSIDPAISHKAKELYAAIGKPDAKRLEVLKSIIDKHGE